MIFANLLINTCLKSPEKIGFIDGKNYTFEHLAQRAAKVKRSLIELGVKKGDRIAILMSNEYRYIELVFGITAIGAIMVPLNTRLHIKELSVILRDAGATTLFVGEEYLPTLTVLKHSVDSIKNVIIMDSGQKSENDNGNIFYEGLLATAPNEVLAAEGVIGDDIAGLYYTSGTTGRPKGVIHTHQSLLATANHYEKFMECKRDDVWLHTAPMFHIGGIMMFLAYTNVGATQVNLRSFGTTQWLQTCEQNRITSSFLVPTMVNSLLNDPDFNRYDKSSLEKIVYSSSPMPVEVLRKAFEKLPNVKFSQVFGATEVPMFITLSEQFHNVNSSNAKLLSSCGQPFDRNEAKIVTPNGREAAAGEVGEIIAKTPTLAKGYWNLPEETGKAFRENGWYNTGDLGYRDENNLFYIVDRAKDMIITGAENVYSVEVEDILYRHPAILECAVVGVPDEKWGEAVKAVVVVKPGFSLTEEEIRTFARSYLANYKVPKTIDFVNELPKNSIGKIQKHLLRQQYWKGKERMVN